MTTVIIRIAYNKQTNTPPTWNMCMMNLKIKCSDFELEWKIFENNNNNKTPKCHLRF